ncbi:DNA-directed RNA polymerase, subunit L [Trachipleistophora hominis]|uniref:DNA-directed RNA polymerase, subunit L n=1 Tax=Trachipleistophora hominis TaxID=72359 RepID=L7JVI4_TRAHO|nr:DNA-directed RNA polymerase, subunit L [Trachipleistophora hominis]
MTLNSYTDPNRKSQKDYELIKNTPRITRLSSTTIRIAHEDHTLMNVVQYFLMQRPFIIAGYVIPHLSEDVVELSIVGKDDMKGNVFDWLCDALKDLEAMGGGMMEAMIEAENEDRQRN